MTAQTNTDFAFFTFEIKARHRDLQKIRNFLNKHGAEKIGNDYQVDTYFKVAKGRLKLREGNIENHLIWYQRPNKKGPKRSKTLLYKSTPGSTLKEVLTKSMDVLAVIEKRREIFFIENVKFHLDEVKSLGSFIEIEAIDYSGKLGLPKLKGQAQHYIEVLGIKQTDLLTGSYSDMILGRL